ncbi:MAG: DUF7344 domain-containing protein [Halodesulfurarchaeum sp.]
MREYTSEEIDRRFALLAQPERRYIVHFLLESETEYASIGDLVSYLQRSDTGEDERDTIALALHHTHLPKLATTSVLDYDAVSGTVRYYGDDLVETLLESIPEKPITNG